MNRTVTGLGGLIVGVVVLASACSASPGASSPSPSPSMSASVEAARSDKGGGAGSSSATAAGPDDKWTVFNPADPMTWDPCAGPIRVVVDKDSIPRKQSAKLSRALTSALQAWAAATGLTFVDGGVVDVTYDKVAGTLAPVNGRYEPRTLYLSLVDYGGMMSKGVVGLAGPSSGEHEVGPNGERSIITSADGSFLRDYVYHSTPAEVRLVFMHEIGHALGLGHSGAKTDVMYPILGGQRSLGPGDIAGIHSLISTTCAAATD